MKPEQLSEYIEIANSQSFEKAFEQAFQDDQDALKEAIKAEMAKYCDLPRIEREVQQELQKAG